MIGWYSTVPFLARLGLVIALWLARAIRRDVDELWQLVHQARGQGLVLHTRIAGASDSDVNRSRLTRAVVTWYGGFEENLARLAPELYERYRSPGIPVGTMTFEGREVIERRDEPITLNVLQAVVRDDLRRLRQIHRYLTWPRRLFRLQEAVLPLLGRGLDSGGRGS